MATGHGMAVLTNSCVKNPRMPGSRLAASFSERLDTTKIRKGRQGQKRSPGRRTESVDEFLRSDDDEEPNGTATAPQEVWLKPEEREPQAAGDYDYTGEPQRDHGDIDRTVDPIGDLANEMSNMSTDDFYEKMQELKREHQKTLSMVHGLYEEIREAEDRRSHREQNGGASMDSEDTEELFRDLDDLRSSFRASRSADKIRDMTAAKPPLPTTSSRPPSVSSSKFAWSGKRDQDIDLNYLKRARSLSEQDLRRVGSDSYASSDDEFELDGRTSPWRQTTPGPTPMSRIDNMWDDFSVEDYAPRGRSVSRASRTSVSTKKSKEWSPKITIPEPFEMTLREASKPKKKTSAMLALQEHLITKQQREEAELQKKFKASPAPAHVYVPMFDDIMREQEEKRQQIRQYSKEILKSMEKPFSFYKREEEKKKERLEKAQFMMKTSPKKKKVKQFKAKPVPKSLHDPAAADRILEDEEYRAIKKKMRAEELMRSASLPPSMQARENAKKADSYNRILYSKRPRSAGYSFKPKIRHSVPDFDQIHKKLQWELGQKRRAKEATVAEPFNLRTSRIPSNTHKIYEDIERDQQSLKENRWPFKAPRSRPLSSPGRLSTSMDSIPAATTESTRKRTAAVRASLMEREMEEQEWRMRERQKRLKEKEIRKSLAAKARANDQSLALSEVNDDKLKEFRDQERARQLDYKRSLNEMMARVESRPYMFERQSQINARKAAEKKYQEALRNAGVDEDFVAERNSRSRPTSYHVSDSDSDEGSYQNTTGASRDRSPSASEESDLEV